MTPDTYTRLGTEIHRPLLQASLGFTVIPVDQELVAVGGRLHRPPTSLDKIPAYSPSLDATTNGQYPDDSSKIMDLTFLAAHDSSNQPGRVTERHTPETATAESEIEGGLSEEDIFKLGQGPCNGPN